MSRLSILTFEIFKRKRGKIQFFSNEKSFKIYVKIQLVRAYQWSITDLSGL